MLKQHFNSSKTYFFRRDDWGVGNERKMDSWIWNQVSLELVQVHIESSVKSERSRDGGHNLGNQTIEVGVGRPLNVEIPRRNYTS